MVRIRVRGRVLFVHMSNVSQRYHIYIYFLSQLRFMQNFFSRSSSNRYYFVFSYNFIVY